MLLPHDVSISSDVPFIREELSAYLEKVVNHRVTDGGYPIRVQVTGEGTERYTISVSPTETDITGGTLRGAVYGMYAFLEKCLGCQFLAEDCEILPQGPVELQTGCISESPAFAYREVYWRGALDGRFALKMRLNSARAAIPPEWGGRVMFYNYSHTFELLVPASEFYDAHPEYFSMVNGVRQRDKSQLCLTNPDVLQIVIERVLTWMRENRDCTIFSVAMNDWYSPCACPACTLIDEKEGSHAGTMIAFVNAVADAVREEFPQNYIHTFAYLYCRKPPRTLRPRSNVIVRLCSIESCFSHPMGECDFAVEHIDVETTSARHFAPAKRLFRQDLAAWASICDSLYIWDYTTNFANYLQPFPNLHVLAPNLRLFRDCGVLGVFEQGNYAPGSTSAFAPLKIYLIAKLLWNPDADVDRLTAGFVNGYYGEAAAGPILKILELSREAVGAEHMSLFDGVNAPYLGEPFLLECQRLFEDALALPVSQVERERIQREALSVRYAYLAALPLDAPGRIERINAFERDAKELGIKELFERRELNASFDCMRTSRYTASRDDVPYAVYRL